MELFYREIGKGRNILILHGLYGMSDNWMTIAKEFSKDSRVILPDLRNHGNSPHSEIFTIKSMVSDLAELYEKLNIKKSVLIGHSLGGKTVMDFATEFEEKVEKLIIVDIAPRNYNKKEFEEHQNHRQIINFLTKVDLSAYTDRKTALEDISKIDKTGKLLFFMMKNISRNKEGKLYWKINLKTIADNLSNILNEYSVELSKIKCPTMFIKGEKSNYLTENDFEYIKSQMKDVKFEIIKDASHWLHAEKTDEFVKIVREFI